MDEGYEQEKKIDLMEILMVGMFAVCVDIIDIIPFMSDFTDWVAGPLFQFYLYIKGYKGTAMLICNGLKLIPFVGSLPLRTVAWGFTVYIENRPALRAIAGVAEKAMAARGGAGAKVKDVTDYEKLSKEFPESQALKEAAAKQGGASSGAGEAKGGKEKSAAEERRRELALGAPETTDEMRTRESFGPTSVERPGPQEEAPKKKKSEAGEREVELAQGGQKTSDEEAREKSFGLTAEKPRPQEDETDKPMRTGRERRDREEKEEEDKKNSEGRRRQMEEWRKAEEARKASVGRQDNKITDIQPAKQAQDEKKPQAENDQSQKKAA